MLTDVEIAQQAVPEPITAVAGRLGLAETDIELYGPVKAKVTMDAIHRFADRPDGRLILVTGITPTPAGEGKTTTTIGLGDALRRLGHSACIAIREPSLGPCFGLKGGATGGGYAQVIPMVDINLHFNGDFHAITSAHNLLSALLDNHIHRGDAFNIDPYEVMWRRVIDMNDRSLREIVTGLGGRANGLPRQTGFDITTASEVMALLCLATDLEDLKRRLARIVVALDRQGNPVTAEALKASGAMAVLLRDAIKPNLVQTLEGDSGVRPRGAIRQHRARLQLRHRHSPGAEAGGLCDHRSGVRERPGRGEVFQYQMPHGRSDARVCGGGGDSARAQNARWSRQGSSGGAGYSGAGAGAG